MTHSVCRGAHQVSCLSAQEKVRHPVRTFVVATAHPAAGVAVQQLEGGNAVLLVPDSETSSLYRAHAATLSGTARGDVPMEAFAALVGAEALVVWLHTQLIGKALLHALGHSHVLSHAHFMAACHCGTYGSRTLDPLDEDFNPFGFLTLDSNIGRRGGREGGGPSTVVLEVKQRTKRPRGAP